MLKRTRQRPTIKPDHDEAQAEYERRATVEKEHEFWRVASVNARPFDEQAAQAAASLAAISNIEESEKPETPDSEIAGEMIEQHVSAALDVILPGLGAAVDVIKMQAELRPDGQQNHPQHGKTIKRG